jgi:hypothetical protein
MKRVSVLVASSVLLAFSGSSVEAAKVASRDGCVNLRSQPSIDSDVIRCLPSGTNLEPAAPLAAARKIAEGRYWVGATGMAIEVKGQQYQHRDEETTTDWKPISQLAYIKEGVFKAGETYWCLSTMPHHRLAVCSAKGWVRSR